MRGALSRTQGVLVLAAMGVACVPAPAKAPDEAAASGEAVPAAVAPPDPTSPEEVAKRAAPSDAKAWLALLDQEQYPASWDTAAPLFQSSVTQEKWEEAARGAREPLGGVSRRELRAAEYQTSLPGAPEGEYVVVHYDSAFANKEKAREIVTMMRTEDKSWKVVGYFVE